MKSTFYLILCLLAASILPANELAAMMPANDNVCDATPLTLDGDCSAGPNIDLAEATAQAGEPLITCSSEGEDTVAYNSVWFTYVATAEEVYFLAAPDNPNLRQSFQMNVYTVSGDCTDFANFTEVFCINPRQPFITAPSLRATLTEGVTYYIRVSGRTSTSPPGDPFSDTGCLTVRRAADITTPNDNVCNAIALEVDSAAVLGNNLNATVEVGEFGISPPPANNFFGTDNSGWVPGTNFLDNSVWYTFTTDEDGGNYSVDLNGSAILPGNFNTQVAIYAATDCADFSTFTLLEAGDNGFPFPNPLSVHTKLDLFCLPANTTYHVAVDGGASFFFMPTTSQGFFRIQVTEEVAEPITMFRSATFAPSCAGETDGSILTAFTGGTGDYTFAWSTGESTQDLVGALAAGDYTISVTDQCGFEVEETFTLGAAQADGPVASPLGADMTVCVGEEVQLNANASGGRPLQAERLFTHGFVAQDAVELRSSWINFPERSTTISDTQRVLIREMEFVGEVLYGATSDAKLYEIDGTTGAQRFIDSMALNGVVDLSYDRSTGQLHATDFNNTLYAVTPATAAVDSLYQLPESLLLFAIDTSGILYGVSEDSLFQIEVASGIVLSGIPSDVAPSLAISGLEIDPATDELYFVQSTSLDPGVTVTAFSRFFRLDKATGESTSVVSNLAQGFRTSSFAIRPGSTSTYAYSWMPSAAVLDDGTSATPSFTADTTITFTVSVTDACDVVAMESLTVTVAPVDSVTIDTAITVGDVYEGITINGDTVIVRTLMNVNGCDSIVTTNVDAWAVSTFDTWPLGAINISPNPTMDRLVLKTEGISEREVSVVVRDILGRPLQQHTLLGGDLTLDVSTFAAGQYYLELRSATKRAIRKFVKQ